MKVNWTNEEIIQDILVIFTERWKEEGKRKEERGKRKEDRRERKEER